MNLDTMTAVYNALSAGLPDIPVTRSWPQTEPYLPGCAFHLASWSLEKDGSKKTEILVTLRVLQQSQGDQFSDQVVAALAPLGFVLQHAQDAQEQDTGFFLRLLSLVKLEAGPEPTSLLHQFRVYDGSAWLALDFPLQASFKPCSRPLINPASFSYDSSLLPLMELGIAVPGSILLTSSVPSFSGDPAVDLLRIAFIKATDVRFSFRKLAPAPSSPFTYSYAIVTAFHRSALGFYCQLTLRQLTGAN